MILSRLVPLSQILLLALSSNANAFQVNIPSRKVATSSTKPIHKNPSSHATLSTSLYSINNLIEELNASASSGKSRTVFVGGKGGVGKTTVSSSIAVTLASDYTSDLKVLVVSTDPAHSLGDALDVDLKSAHGKKVQMTDPLTGGKLYAMEVDTDAALEKFQDALMTFDVNKLSQALGVKPELLDGLGLGELSSLLNNPPPGLDELIALSNILNDPDITKEFDVVVVDTAPTGHTLRMLALPEFLDGFLGKLLELRMKLSGMANMLQSFLGGGDAAAARAQTVDDALDKLEEFRSQMGDLRKKLKDGERTDFVVVSVPTTLSVNESKRLMKELDDQGVKVSNIVINQCVIGDGENDSTSESNEAMKNYYERRKAGQGRWINELKSATQDVSGSEEYKSNGAGEIHVTEVPFFDVELIGTPALGYVGQTSFANNPHFDHLLNDSGDSDDAKFVICGGKGGVGKTTTSSSLAVTMAAAGRNVALVSTDPAHSLGDAFDLDFRGGELVDVPLIGVPPSDGSLSVLEVDPSKSIGEFKGLIDKLIGNKTSSDSNSKGSDLSKTLRELGEVFDTLPAGTDEVVALAKVVNLMKKGGFDRIVLDTAPTGHTLRMLSTPGFISELIDKVLKIAEKVNSNSMVKMMISSAASGEDMDETALAAKKALLSFQFQMYDLEDIFSNAEQTEFLIVTVPTELAVRESVRLLNDLTFDAPDMPIKVRNVVANQVLKNDGSDVSIFLNKIAEGQKSSIRDLRNEVDRLGKSIEITEVPYLDTEPRGVFGLKVLSAELLKESKAVANLK